MEIELTKHTVTAHYSRFDALAHPSQLAASFLISYRAAGYSHHKFPHLIFRLSFVLECFSCIPPDSIESNRFVRIKCGT